MNLRHGGFVLVVILALVSASVLLPFPSSMGMERTVQADDAEAIAAGQAKLRKIVERKIGRNESPFYVIAISKTSYPKDVERITFRAAGGKVRKTTEFQSTGDVPVFDVVFSVQAGREECIEFVYEQMAKFVQVKSRSRKSKRPPPADWKLIGRFKDAAKAEAAKSAAEVRYSSQPRWVAASGN